MSTQTRDDFGAKARSLSSPDGLARASAPAIAATGVVKRYGGAVALGGVDFIVERGEVHGLIGKNGAGKSTLLAILSGAQRPDAGEVSIGGRILTAPTPAAARRAGVAAVYQNPQLHLDLTVAQNIFLGFEPRTRLGLIDDKAMVGRAAALLSGMGLGLAPQARLGDLDIALRQQVAIAKAVHREASVLLLDEPTSALNSAQVDFLFRLIRKLAAEGLAIVYVSHHLDEVRAIADRITLLRDGHRVAVVDSASVDKDQLIAMMVGESGATAHSGRLVVARSQGPLLTLESLSVPGEMRGVSLDIHGGEIIGVTGLTGSGARALAEVVGGLRTADGRMTVLGADYAPRSPKQAIARGVIFVPEDMRARGLVMPLPVAQNVTLARVRALTRGYWLDLRKERAEALRMIDHLKIAPRVPEREVQFLSGGNQRKALLARALFAEARLLVLEEPTQGVDVDARRQIHELLRRFVVSGAAVILVSTDLEELIGLADRIVVLRDGRIDHTLSPAGLTPDRLLAAIQSDKKQSGASHG